MNKKFNNENLVELKDLMISPFYIHLDKKYRQFLIKLTLKKKKDFKTVAKEIGCNPYTLRQFKCYEERHIRSDFLKNLLDLLHISIQDAEQHVVSIKRGCTNRPVAINLPIKATSELALLIAKVCGDGSILSDWRFSYTNNQLNLIQEVINAVETSIGNTKYILQNRVNRRIYEIKLSSVIGYILNLIGGPKGYKVNQKFEIPSWIMNGNEEIKSSFLRGIFDDESCADLNQNLHRKRILLAMSKTILYENSLKSFLEQIKDLLFQFNIKTGSIHVQQRYDDKIILKFAIYQKSNFENFQEFIGFTHNNKKRILREIINSYIDKHKTKKAILETLSNSKNPLTITEIAKLNGVRRELVRPHLCNLLKENIIKKIDENPIRWFKEQ